MQTQTSNTLHNAIMEVSSKDRPSMLAPDTEVLISEGSPDTRTESHMETYKTVSQDIRDQLNAEAEAVQIILTGIDNDIYSTVDACPNACEMWKAIERFYKIMNELIRNQCDVTNHQVNVQFLLQLQQKWQRFVTLVKQSQELKTVSYHKLYDILKQHQNEVNEIKAERIARVANLLALVAQQQPDKEIDKLMDLISLSFKKIYKPTNNNLRTSSNTSRANQDNSPRINRSTRYENQRIGNVARARETVGSTVVQKSGIQCYNCKEFGHVARECQKPKRRDNTNDELKDQELEAHYMYMAQLQEVSPDAADSGPIFNAEPLQKVSNDDHYNVFAIESEHPEQSEYVHDTYPIEQNAHNLNAKQADWRYDTDDDELEDQELEAHYMYMAQLQEVSPDVADSVPIFDDEPLQKVSNDDHYNVFAIESAHPEQSKSVHDIYPIKQDAQIVIIDSLDMNYDKEEIDQNDDDNDLAKERELLASLIEKLKCEIDESKNRNKFLETSNKVLIEKLKGEIEVFKNKNKSLESSNNFFKEANNRLSETNNLLYADYKKSEAELARRNSKEYVSQMKLNCAKVRGDFLSYKMESQKSCTKYTDTINDLNQTILEIKDKLSAQQETITILSQQKEAQIKLYKTREDKEVDKVIELEQKVKVLDNIVYKTGHQFKR
nr:Gag-Pol polyprotein [Tanacetum cinerariifolium]